MMVVGRILEDIAALPMLVLQPAGIDAFLVSTHISISWPFVL
jgi:hypothetical protein